MLLIQLLTDGTWVTRCDCGWRSPACASADEAHHRSTDHVAETGHPPTDVRPGAPLGTA